jgi:hypothetical protein
LHWHVLLEALQLKKFEDLQDGSLAALDAVTKMVIEIAHAHQRKIGSYSVDTLPPTCSYILRAALKHLDMDPHLEEEEWLTDYMAVSGMLGQLNHRWSVTGT